MFNKLLNSLFKFSQKKKINYWANSTESYIFKFKDFNLWSKSQNKQILKNINLELKNFCVIGIIGPSGSGKSTLLRSMNKSIYDDGEYFSTGELIYKNINIIKDEFPNEILRTQIGLVFQKPIMFHMSIKENLVFALRAHGVNEEGYLNQKVETLLKNCFLWEELKDRLDENPTNTLSGGQQQRLCIARALALNPLVLLMDEPTSSLDPTSNGKIEELIMKISKDTMIIIVSHSLTQVRRISDYTLFLKNGEIIEFDVTRKIFTNPKEKLTRDYVSSKY